MLVEAAAQVAPVVSEARTLDRFIAPAQERLWALARNLWWSWDHDSTSLFRDLDPGALAAAQSQSGLAAGEIPLAEIERRAGELVLHSRINYAYRRQREYLEADRTWGARTPAFCGRVRSPISRPNSGCTNPIPVYSGGLGVLAGDHIKSASDLDIPLVGIGLFYGQGYFRQRLDRNGWQQEEYLQTDVNQLPMEPAIGTNGEPVTVQIETRGGSIRAKVWRMKVGRCDLLLLDSNVEGNAPGRPRTHLAPVRRRRPHPHPPGIAAGRRRLSRPEAPWASRPASCTSTKATADLPCSKPFAAAWRKKGSELRSGRAARFPRSGFHHPHPRARRP